MAVKQLVDFAYDDVFLDRNRDFGRCHGRAAGDGPAEAFDLQVYRDQLTEVDRDLTRGVISEEDAERLRTEISRRILAADAKASARGAGGTQPKPLGYAVASVIGALVVGGSYWLYSQLGAPGYGDLGLSQRLEMAELARENRPSQAEAESQMPATGETEVQPEYADLVQRLRGAVAERPGDLQGHILLARSEAALGNYVAAYEAQQQVLSIKGDGASGKDYADLGDMMVLAAGGYVSPEAERVLEAALAREPDNGVALYYMGLMMAQTGRPDVAFRLWDRLLRQSPPDASWLPPILAQIEEMAFRAGVNLVMYALCLHYKDDQVVTEALGAWHPGQGASPSEPPPVEDL